MCTIPIRGPPINLTTKYHVCAPQLLHVATCKNNKIKPTKRDHTRPHIAHYTMPMTLPFLLGSMALSKSIKMSHHPSSNSTNSLSITMSTNLEVETAIKTTPSARLHASPTKLLTTRGLIDSWIALFLELQNEPPPVV